MSKRIFRLGPVLVALVALAVPVVASQPAHAQSVKSMQERFYDMDTQKIDGKVAKPTASVIDSHPRPMWPRLLRLAKSMRAPLKASQTDQALR